MSTLERPRLTNLLERAWSVPLTVVAAPAGSGKSWLLAGFANAERAEGRKVLWYQADRATREESQLARHLHDVLSTADLTPGAAPGSVADLATELQQAAAAEVVLVIDDAHVLLDTQAEAGLAQLVEHLPRWLHIAMLSRQPPRFDLSRLRLADELLEIGPDELRFRSWEAEDLFRLHHGQELPPEEIADLSRRTGGWAAGLHLYHLAIKGKPAAARRQMLMSLPTRLRGCRDYLTGNVLAGLEDDLRGFLVDASVLGVL
ncbi:MAG TPA: AAA family ATPase, partial [Acidimicrobiales bacterium]|nr:AAA family ATPase [Acidimicrobiales bacterium]